MAMFMVVSCCADDAAVVNSTTLRATLRSCQHRISEFQGMTAKIADAVSSMTSSVSPLAHCIVASPVLRARNSLAIFCMPVDRFRQIDSVPIAA
jgi:hypothetical protein